MKSSLKKSNILPGDICLAVSGGADSVAMLLALYELKVELKLNISVRHFEHGIRGEESIKDAEFVEKLCQSLSVPFFIGSGDVKSYASENGLSIEEAARKLRYEFLLQTDAGQIATAHTADDNAETILFNLIRGSGISGLSGIDEISYMEGKRIVRPLIGVTRTQVEEFLKERGQDYCLDSTNLQNEYSRNKIRNEIIPLLEGINPGAKGNINRAADLLKQNYIFVKGLAKDYLHNSAKGKVLNTAGWNKLNEYLIKEIIRLWLSDNLEGAKDVGRVHIESVYELSKGLTGKRVDIPGAFVQKSYDNLILEIEKSKEEIPGGIGIDVASLANNTVAEYSFMGMKVYIKKFEYKGQNISKEMYTKCFDCDKIGKVLLLRTGEKKDYFTIDTKLSKKKFNRFCIDEKIPIDLRDKIPVFAVGSHIVWAVSHRMSEYFKVSATTGCVLEITVKEC